MSGPAGFVPSYPITCPPSQRTFNSDGTRISEVGLKDWKHPERGVVAPGAEDTSTAELEAKRLNWFAKKERAKNGADDASITSGLSGETLGKPSAEDGGRRRSLVQKLFHPREGDGEEDKR